MASLKRAPRPKKPASEIAAAALVLNPALVQDARALVSIYDRTDWDQVDKTECDTIHVEFQSVETKRVAIRILLELAAEEPGLRIDFFVEISQAFAENGLPLTRDQALKKQPPRHSDNRVNKLLGDLRGAGSSHRFAELCIQASLLHHKIRRRANQETGKMPPPPPPIPKDPPFWLGPMADDWISIPIRLALAAPVVGLCRRIAGVNTGETTLRLRPGEEHSLQQYLRLFIEGQPLRFHVPADEVDDPFCHQLQETVTDFVPALQKLINTCLNQVRLAKPAAAAEDSANPVVGEMSSKTNELPKQEAGEILPARENGGEPENRIASGVRSEEKHQSKTVKITIMANRVVLVNEKRTGNTVLANALLALAALADDGKTEMEVTTGKFVLLSHRNETGRSKKWYRNKKALKEIGLRFGQTRLGVWHISSFEIHFEEPFDRQKLENYLHEQPPRVRRRGISHS
jgi:hypothetical protein